MNHLPKTNELSKTGLNSAVNVGSPKLGPFLDDAIYLDSAIVSSLDHGAGV